MPTDPFNTLQKGRFTLEKINKNSNLFSHDELIDSISHAKTSPNYQTLKLVLLSLETILQSQKQMMRELQGLKK